MCFVSLSTQSMRDLCKEEDYTFLNSLGKQDKRPESRCLESESQEKQEEKVNVNLLHSFKPPQVCVY